jgi:3-hydroxyisobutyrate dehydrogenase-like beta-hydroxyacid dehydrogenase
MSPINPQRLAAPILLGGAHARDFEPVARAIGFSGASFYSEIPGKTAAAKLCRSVIIKGMEALIAESLLAARHYGVEEDVLASLGNLFPHPDWDAHARYMIGRTLQHGTRRAAEMREAARTVAEAKIDPWMSNATALRQAWAGALEIKPGAADLLSLLDAIRTSISEMMADDQETSA